MNFSWPWRHQSSDKRGRREFEPSNYYQASHDAHLMHFHSWATQTHTKNAT